MDATTIQVGLLGTFKFDGGTASYVTLNLAGGTLDASVPLVNNAIINGFGTINASSTFVNHGTVNFSGGTTTVNGTAINAADGMMTTVGSTSVFNGDVTNTGNFTAGGATNFSHSLTNIGNLINLGTMSTTGILNNTGTLTNSAILNTVITLNGGALTNNGTFSAANLTNSRTFSNFGIAIIGDFSNTGAYIGDPSSSQFQNVNIGAGGYISGTMGDLFKVTGNLQNFSTQNTLWNTSSSELDFTGGGTHVFGLPGQNGAGFTNNFAWGTLAIDPGNTVDLGTGSGDALYVDFLQGLDISGNTIN